MTNFGNSFIDSITSATSLYKVNQILFTASLKYTLFLKTTLFFNSAPVLLNFFMN